MVRRRSTGGIKGLLLKKARIAIASTEGDCELCGDEGRVRYFVAAKLPRFLYLCDPHYTEIRNRLEQCLKEILEEDLGLEV